MERKSNGALTGTMGWTKCHIVLDVPAEATSIHYGFLLSGFGRVFARSFRLESVGREIAPTKSGGNLDFLESRHSAV